MKKKLVFALIAAILVIALMGGSVSAKGLMLPQKGDKLVGLAQLGRITVQPPVSLDEQSNSGVWFTNTDDENDILITKVLVINGSGDMIYQGPYILYTPNPETREVITRPMNPHEIWRMQVAAYFWTGAGTNPNDLTASDNWRPPPDILNGSPMSVTVEIYWQAANKKGAVCPLSGWVDTRIIQYQAGGNTLILRNAMINMTQK
jgi:hypothetical protein